MAYVYDEQEKGFRLTCEDCGKSSPIVSLEESGVRGLEWYCNDPPCEQAYQAIQRARLKLAVMNTERKTADEAETFVAGVRWDLMPNGKVIDPPTKTQIDKAEAHYPELAIKES